VQGGMSCFKLFRNRPGSRNETAEVRDAVPRSPAGPLDLSRRSLNSVFPMASKATSCKIFDVWDRCSAAASSNRCPYTELFKAHRTIPANIIHLFTH
jgi:predicted nucleic-acid-binding Zn-ribbon protein